MKKRFIPILVLPLMMGACNKINISDVPNFGTKLSSANSSSIFAFEAATSVGMLNTLSSNGVKALLNETTDESLVEMIKEYLPSIEAAMNGGDLLSSVVESESDLEGYTYKVEVNFVDIISVESSFTLYYNETELIKDNHDDHDDEDDTEENYPDYGNNHDHDWDNGHEHDYDHDHDWEDNHDKDHEHDWDGNYGHGHGSDENSEEVTDSEETSEEVVTSEETFEETEENSNSNGHHHGNDDREFAIEGIVIIGDETFEIYGKKELDDNEKYEVEFKFIVDNGSYIEVSQEIEEDETELSYTIVNRGREIYSYSLEFDNDEVELSIKDSSTYSKYTLSFKFIDWDGKTLIKATVKDGKNKTFILFEKVINEETGEVDYIVID